MPQAFRRVGACCERSHQRKAKLARPSAPTRPADQEANWVLPQLDQYLNMEPGTDSKELPLNKE
ncbi:hypothetical protein [Adhaeribacter arboris]|uniref:hypothetical protein n=1 Tax=Adhaeribacter arboris TaxID=2072846 RepID=UPI0011B29BEB|nr:hypothetical protein [Adhaeribacter arboris]